MRLGKLPLTMIAAGLLAVSIPSKADNGGYTYTGGAFSEGASIVVSGAPLSVGGATLSFTCPVTVTAGATLTCAGGSVTIGTADNSVVFNGSFVSGSPVTSASGGGKGGHTTYTYQFAGSFNGTVTAGGVTQGANGSISQYVSISTPIGAGTAAVTNGSFGWSSAYSPVLVADNSNGRILAADNIAGANYSSFGAPGSGAGEFTAIAGITEDAAGHIYATDSALSRLIRVDDATGKNWVALGGPGGGAMQFSAPHGVVVDAAGKIWVADAGNNRIVRMDDMSGTNWVSFGALGTGANQFSGPAAIAFDSLGRIYVADKGNGRLVRFDDLTGKNWVSLSEVLINPYGYPFGGIDAVSVNAAGEIFVATGGSTGYLIRCGDMTGASPSVSLWMGGINSMSVDLAGTIYVTGGFTPGLAQTVDAAGTGSFASGLGGAVTTPGPVYVAATTSPAPAEGVLSLRAASFASRNVGEPGLAKNVTLENLGAGVLAIDSIAAGSDFKVGGTCRTALTGGASCMVSVSFDPTATGVRTAELSVASNGVHPTHGVALKGFGTAPTALVLPGALTFDGQQTLTGSAAQAVTLVNSGTGPLTISSITAAGDFSESNNCGGKLQPGAGCSIGVVFKPTVSGARGGILTISDDAQPAGTTQTVTLTGTGAAAAPLLTLTPEAIQFPNERVGTVSGGQTVTLKNSSAAGVSLGAPVSPAGFKVTTSCGATLGAGSSCGYRVAFAPGAAGPVSGAFTVAVAGQTELKVALSGRGTAEGTTAPVLVANPVALNFGQVVYADTQSLSFTVTNTSGLPTAIAAHGLFGASAITLTSYGCPAILASGASCTVTVMFTSTSATPLNDAATFEVIDGAGVVTQVPITGQAVANGG